MKNRVFALIPLILLLSVFCVSALEVELTFPSHGAVYEISNTINFKCKPIGDDLVQLTLHTDISGTMEQTGSAVTTPTNNTEYIFNVNNIENGIYNWNCHVLSSSDPYHAEATSDRQVEVNFQNDPPAFTGVIPNQTWNQDTSNNNAFDLDDYFEDPDTITYSVTGNSNINIGISSGQVSFSQPSSWWGTETVTFRATDISGYTESNEVTLTVNQVNPSNEAPTISGVPDQEKEIDDEWTIDLNSYINDDEDSDDDLNISVSGVDTSIFTVSVDDEYNELTFTAVDEGTDDFTIKVRDTDGATDSQTITVTIEEEGTTTINDDQFDDEISIEITKTTPEEYTKINIKPGETQIFEININENGDIIWYVDNIRKKEDSKTFTYAPTSSNIGSHIIKVIVGSGIDKDMKTWDIEVIGNITEECGNKIVENNETCLTCPEDVPCQEGEYCDEGECKTKSIKSITGFVIKSKDFVLKKWYYPTLILAVILFLIIFGKIIGMNKEKAKRESDPLAQFSEKSTLKQRIRRKLREWDKKRQLRKQDVGNVKILETNKKENIRATAPGIESIKTFINQKLYEGNSKGEIKRVLRRKGWNRGQIRKAFKSIKNDSRKPT